MPFGALNQPVLLSANVKMPKLYSPYSDLLIVSNVLINGIKTDSSAKVYRVSQVTILYAATWTFSNKGRTSGHSYAKF